MTFWYDEEAEELVENNPDDWFERAEDGTWHFDVSNASKRDNVIRTVEQMKEAHEGGGA